MLDDYSNVQKIILFLPPLLFAITVHEVAHGWIAMKLGDPTAKILGRLTLNPIQHIDIIGTILVPIALFFLGGFVFGWAKPVPITWSNLRHPKRDKLLVALAGPAANGLMILIWASVAKVASLFFNEPMIAMGMIGIVINSTLIVLNLLPIPPLDGSHILSYVLPDKAKQQLDQLEPYSFLLLIILLMTGILSLLITPVTQWIMHTINLWFNFF